MLGEICGESVSKIQLEQCKGIKRIEKQLQREPILRMTSCMTFNVVVSILAMPWGDSMEVKGPYKSFHRIISAGCVRGPLPPMLLPHARGRSGNQRWTSEH